MCCHARTPWHGSATGMGECVATSGTGSPWRALVQRDPEVLCAVAARVECAERTDEGGRSLTLHFRGLLWEVRRHRVHLCRATHGASAVESRRGWVYKREKRHTSVHVWRPSSSRSAGHASAAGGSAAALPPGGPRSIARNASFFEEHTVFSHGGVDMLHGVFNQNSPEVLPVNLLQIDKFNDFLSTF